MNIKTVNWQKFTLARIELIFRFPFYGALIMRLRAVVDYTAPTFWVDGKNLGFSPAYLESLTNSELVWVLAHEILHCALGHIWRRNGRDHELWNKACDLAIWAILRDCGFTAPRGVLEPTKDQLDLSAEQIYRQLEQEAAKQKKQQQGGAQNGQGTPKPSAPQQGQQPGQPQQGASQGGQGAGQEEFHSPGEMRDPDSSDPEVAPSDEQEWKVATFQAANVAAGLSKLPETLKGLVQQLKKPANEWKARCRIFVQEITKEDYSWKMPNTRYIPQGLFLPCLRSERTAPLVIVIDTSGSVSLPIFNSFLAECQNIMDEVQPSSMHILCADDLVRSAEEFFLGDEVKVKPRGNGGTDFRPAFQWVEEQGINPSGLVYLTDLCPFAPWPEEPGYPVLWAVSPVPGMTPKPAPWGEQIEVEEDL